MDRPTAAQILDWSKVAFGELGYADADDLERLIVRAEASFRRITGLTMSTVATEDEPLVQQAIQGMTEQLAMQEQQENIETLSDFSLIQSFTAGAYTETRRSMDDMLKAKMVNPWPWLNRLLWGLMTPDKLAEWEEFFLDGNAPATSVTEVQWWGTSHWPYDEYLWGA